MILVIPKMDLRVGESWDLYFVVLTSSAPDKYSGEQSRA